MSQLATLQVARQRAADLLDQAAACVPEDAAPLRQAAERLRDGLLTIVLVGSFSTGKSTLINALLGRALLPARVNPCTAFPCDLRYGEVLSVTLTPADGSPPLQGDATLLARALDLASDQSVPLERALIEAPLPLLQLGVTLLDTPGLDDDQARTERTLQALHGADAVIFVSSATRFLTELERRVIHEHLLPAGLDNLFVAVTMVDLLERLVDEPEQARRVLLDRARQALGPLVEGPTERIFLLSPREALLAQWNTAQGAPIAHGAAPASSGLPAFEDALEQFLVHERGGALLRGAAGRAQRVHDRLAARLDLLQRTASDTLESLASRQSELEPRLAEVDALCVQIERLAEQAVARSAALVRQDLRDFLWQLESEVAEVVRAAPLDEINPLFALTPAGQARAHGALQEHLDRWMAERTLAWQARLGERLEQSLSGLRRELTQAATDFDALAGNVLRDFTGRAESSPPRPEALKRGERWFSVALGAVLLSPGAMVAGWTDGYAGALRGAAGRLGARLTATTLAAALGPAGWAGLTLYALTDAALLWSSGSAQLRRLREDATERLGQALRDQADAPPEQIEAPLREALAPLAEAVSADVRADAAALRAQLDDLLHTRADVRGRLSEELGELEARRTALGAIAAELAALARP